MYGKTRSLDQFSSVAVRTSADRITRSGVPGHKWRQVGSTDLCTTEDSSCLGLEPRRVLLEPMGSDQIWQEQQTCENTRLATGD